jgi:hypothetical protein
MLIEYVNKAMSKAVYDKLDNGTFTGKIPQCSGVVAFGESLYPSMTIEEKKRLLAINRIEQADESIDEARYLNQTG